MNVDTLVVVYPHSALADEERVLVVADVSHIVLVSHELCGVLSPVIKHKFLLMPSFLNVQRVTLRFSFDLCGTN